jgi:UDP-N-acetylmuramoyl-tripeptide--D-alanyl-D-alanine ligase
MIELSLSEISEALNGELVVGRLDTRVAGKVSTDSRELGAGDIFFAKHGEQDDGHRYLDAVAADGIALAVVSEPRADLKLNQIVVADTVVALSALAELVLNRVRKNGLKVLGITGSNGKTSTKNMVAAMLSELGETVSPIGSYNNEVGLPLTVLTITAETKFLVLEYGAAGLGSIARLSSWTKPDVAAVLKVGMAHAGNFGGIENTAKIKAELFQDITQLAVINADDPIVSGFRPAKTVPVRSFGFDSHADVRILRVEITLAGTSVQLMVDGKPFSANLQILGEHQALNLAAALVLALGVGCDPQRAIAAVEKLENPGRWRMQLTKAPAGHFVINDAYNASPESMRAALQTLATLGRQGHRTIAVLGHMAELDQFSVAEHDQVGRLVVRYNIDHLFAVGEGSKLIHMGAMQEGSWAGESEHHDSISGGFDAIREKLRAGDVVLVKASNSTGLRFLGDDLAGLK